MGDTDFMPFANREKATHDAYTRVVALLQAEYLSKPDRSKEEDEAYSSELLFLKSKILGV